jgi:biopolymer transport protein ExbD
MRKKHQQSSIIGLAKHSGLLFKHIIIGSLLLLTIIFSACGSSVGQSNQISQSKKSVLPGNVKYPDQDNRIQYESSCVITINDDSGAYFMGKDLIAKDQLVNKILEKLKDEPESKYNQDYHIVYIKSSESVKYSTVIALLQLIRQAKIIKVGLVVGRQNAAATDREVYKLPIKIEDEVSDMIVNSNDTPILPNTTPRETVTRKPNPLLLVTSLKKDGKLQLNRDEAGEFSNPEILTAKLVKIFKERESSGTFRDGTNEVEKSVWLEAPLNTKYGDVVRLIDAIKGTGADQIFLKLNHLLN